MRYTGPEATLAVAQHIDTNKRHAWSKIRHAVAGVLLCGTLLAIAVGMRIAYAMSVNNSI